MNAFSPFLFAQEHGGDAVKGGGHPAGSSLPASEPIEDALGHTVTGHAKTPGTADPGVPGSRTNPVTKRNGNQSQSQAQAQERQGHTKKVGGDTSGI